MWNFLPAPKIAGTERVMPLATTEARVREILSLVPVTRISDLTPLDPLALPVFSAVTPLAVDLTSHLGKGRDAPSAKVSALMEAVERVSAEAPGPGVARRARYADLRGDRAQDVVDPVTLTLPSDSAYHPEKVFTWLQSHELVARRPVWMASDLVTSPPTEGVLREVDTNGLAAGNTHLEAAVHGICEVIERDAWSQHEFLTQFGDARTPQPPMRSIDLATLPEEAGSWAERIRSGGLDLALHDITNDVGVATFRALLTDPHYMTPSGPQPLCFQGFGTHPNAATAALRALTESVQARLSIIQGARDAYNTAPSSRRTFTQARRAQLPSSASLPFSSVASARHDDVLADLHFLLDRLLGSGFERVVVTDLTRPQFSIPVVRVRVPGLSAYVVNRRRVDWRCLRHLL
jgi:ribosomal protein S12 methylthiotransferase accessory factor